MPEPVLAVLFHDFDFHRSLGRGGCRDTVIGAGDAGCGDGSHKQAQYSCDYSHAALSQFCSVAAIAVLIPIAAFIRIYFSPGS